MLTAEVLTMILLKGHPGTGKSSISRLLAKQMRWPVIDKDDSKDILMTQPGCPAERDANALSYSIMLRTAETQLRCGLSVILDCPLAHFELYKRALEISLAHGAMLLVVECICKDHEIWRQRLLARVQTDAGTDKMHKPQTWADIEAIFERYNGCDGWTKDLRPSSELLTIDTSQCTAEAACATVVAVLRALNP